MKTKNTKKRFVLSLVVTIVSIAMLVGATFAWFTDSVTSGKNKIVAGNLAVDLVMDANRTGNYESIANKDEAIFGKEGSSVAQNNSTDTLWEPGKTQYVYLGVENKGNLNLKYNIIISVKDEGLVGALKYAIVDKAKATGDITLEGTTSWEDIVNVADGQVGDVTAGTIKAAENGKLGTGEGDRADYFALAVHMDENAGNEYQGKNVVIDVNVVATQATVEEDSFGPTYDKDAQLPTVVADPSTIEDVLKSVKPGSTVVLQKNEASYGAVNVPTHLESVTIKGGEGVELEKLNIPENAEIKELKIDDVAFKTENDSCFMLQVKDNSKLDVEYYNCKFVGTSTNTDQNKNTQMAFQANAVPNSEYNLYYENCEFINIGRALYPNGGKCDSVVVKNCKFSGGGAWSIIGNNNSGIQTVVIDNCVFDNVCGVAKFNSSLKNAIITNNTFIGNCNQDRSPAKNMFDMNLRNTDSCTVSGNKVGPTAAEVVQTDISSGYGITMP